MNSDVGRNRT